MDRVPPVPFASCGLWGSGRLPVFVWIRVVIFCPGASVLNQMPCQGASFCHGHSRSAIQGLPQECTFADFGFSRTLALFLASILTFAKGPQTFADAHLA